MAVRRSTVRLPAGLAPAVCVGVVLLVVWLLSSVGLLDALEYLGYVLVFVLAPGLLLERVLRPHPRAAIDRLATGWALGYVIELGCFALSATLGARWLLPWLILAVLAGSGAAAARVGRLPFAGREPSWLGWALAGVAALAVVYIAIAFFTLSPLPGTVPSVTYYADFPFHLGLAADAATHWPMGDPKVSGQPIPYHIFVYWHLAAAHQITGLPLSLLLLRLDIPVLVIAFAIAAAATGQALGGKPAVGLLAAMLLLFVGELHPNPSARFTFENTFFYSEYTSPTFMYGLVLFVPALQALAELTSGVEVADRRRRWVLLTLLLLGCGGAKATIMPVLLGGAVLTFAARVLLGRFGSSSGGGGWVRSALALRPLIAAIVLLAVVAGAFQLLLYGSFSGGLSFDPPGSVREMDVISLLATHVHGTLESALFWVVAAVVGIIGFCVAPLIGLLGVVLRPIRQWSANHLLLLGVLVSGFVPFIGFTQFGNSQNFFTYYGYAAGVLLSAEGLVLLWNRWMGERRVRARLVVPAVIGLGVAVVAIYAINRLLSGGSVLHHYLAWFALILVVLAAGIAWAWRARPVTRGPRLMALVAGVVLFGLLEAPLETLPPILGQVRAGKPVYDSVTNELPAGLYRGLEWVQQHTRTSDVLAVNNQYVGTTPAYMYYSAFTERQIFLEGWALTARASEIGAEAVTYHGRLPFPARLALNRAVFDRASRRAMETMFTGYGVRYLLVDKVHGGATPRLAQIARVVYDSPSLVVYRVPAPG
jgi:hypothetical protein